MICLHMDFFLHILFGMYWASLKGGLMSSISFEKFSAIMSSNVTSVPLEKYDKCNISLPSFQDSNYMIVLPSHCTLYVSYPLFSAFIFSSLHISFWKIPLIIFNLLNLFSTLSNCLLISSEFFTLLSVFFSSRIFTWYSFQLYYVPF